MAGDAEILVHKRRKTGLQLLLLAVLTCIGAAQAQTLYKYRGESGEWIYTDRKPADEQIAEVRELEISFVQPEFSVTSEVLGRTIEFVAHNEYYAPIEVRLIFVDISGVSYPHPDNRLRWVVEPRSDLLLLNLEVLDEIEAPSVEYRYEYMAGDPTAQHQPVDGYRVPFAAGLEFPVSQAYPDMITHQTLDSRYAVDIAISEGTDILAARDGIVFDVASTNFRSGLNSSQDGLAANTIRILHDDGTFSLYAHLNWNTIRVKPGDRVRAGQYIADSGNTGFSSGPHLHYSVQRNAGLVIESLPFTFRGQAEVDMPIETGDLLVAY